MSPGGSLPRVSTAQAPLCRQRGESRAIGRWESIPSQNLEWRGPGDGSRNRRGSMHDFTLADRFETISEWRHRGNGLTVLTVPTPVAPVVGFSVVYRVGSRHEVAGHTGATHMLEHLMFKGSENFNAERGTEIARTLHRVGASFNATTWLDRTTYLRGVAGGALAGCGGHRIGSDAAGADPSGRSRQRTHGGAQRARHRRERARRPADEIVLRPRLHRAPVPPPDHRLARRCRTDVRRGAAPVLRHLLPPGQRDGHRRGRSRRGVGSRRSRTWVRRDRTRAGRSSRISRSGKDDSGASGASSSSGRASSAASP